VSYWQMQLLQRMIHHQQLAALNRSVVYSDCFYQDVITSWLVAAG